MISQPVLEINMFEAIADKIFERAGVSKERNVGLYDQAVEILSEKMAGLSATMGLSLARADRFKEQEDALVQDLIEMKEAGDIR